MAGCGKEKDGSGYEDWSVAFDLAEDVDVDGVLVKNCYAEGGWKCNFYYEPETTGKLGAHGTAYVRKNIVLEDCVAVDGGRSGGGFRGTMRIREGENANFYIDTGVLRRCKSYGGSKAGFYARVDRDCTSLSPVYEDCLDCGSNIGYLLELGGADATYRNCVSANAVKEAWRIMGDTVVLENCRVKVRSDQKTPPFHFGGYTRVYLQDSRHTDHQTLVASTSAQSWWPVANLRVSACVQGLPTGVAAYAIHPQTSQSITGVAIRTGCSPEVASNICDRSATSTPSEPTVPTVPDDDDDTTVPFDGILFKNARITPSSGPYGTRFTLVIEPHRGG